MTPGGVLDGFVFLDFIYADPGSGMLIWQLIMAAALGLMFYARTIVRKIRGLIGTASEPDKENSTTKE